MVFSNHYPDVKKLSKDCWAIFHPNKDELKDVLDSYKRNCKKAKERGKENNFGREECDESDYE